MPFICLPSEAAGSHRRLTIGSGRSEQVEDREARRQLILRDVPVISLDHHLCVLPHLGPGASVLGQQSVKAKFFCLLEVLACEAGPVHSGRGSSPRRQTLEDIATIDHAHPLLRRHSHARVARAGEGEVDALHLHPREPVVIGGRTQGISWLDTAGSRLGSQSHGWGEAAETKRMDRKSDPVGLPRASVPVRRSSRRWWPVRPREPRGWSRPVHTGPGRIFPPSS